MANDSGPPYRYSSNYADFPTGIFERAAILRNALMDACTNGGKLDRRLYQGLRREFMSDPETGELLPDIVRANEDISGFLAFLQGLGERGEVKRKRVWDAFMPMLDKLNPRRLSASEPLGDRAKQDYYDRLSGHEPQKGDVILSSGWTGTRTVTEQCVVVLQLAPAALAGLEALIAEQEQRLHNQPPEALSGTTLEALRDLQAALQELLDLADRGLPLTSATAGVRWAVDRAFSVMKDTGELLVGGLPTFTASAITGWGTFAICQLLVGLEAGASTTMGAAAVAATVVEAGRRPKNR